jgi:putative ABC transport system ATP-binding protein
MIRIENLRKSYRQSDGEVPALRSVNVQIAAGELVAMYGASGSGKSTLLNLLSAIDAPTCGSIIVDGKDVARMNDVEATLFRRQTVGFVFQFFNLLPTLNALENVMLPAQLNGVRNVDAESRGRALLTQFGLAERWNAMPDVLSGGQQQRVAICRALINDPPLILADEPTGNLDSETGLHILSLLKDLSRDEGKTVVMATHSHEAARFADRLFHMRDGELVEMLRSVVPPAESHAPANQRA